MRRTLVIASLALLATTGCYASGSATVTATTPSASLVLISPGVYVVEDYNQAVFWYDNYYWRWDGAVWYRSSYYDSGFVVVATNLVPRPIVVIDRPRRYVRYRGRANARRRRVRRRQRQIRRQNRRQDRRQKRRNYRQKRRRR